jgi:hypothetical protein
VHIVSTKRSLKLRKNIVVPMDCGVKVASTKNWSEHPKRGAANKQRRVRKPGQKRVNDRSASALIPSAQSLTQFA